MFLLLHLLTRVAFELDASYSFIIASCVMDLGVEVRPLEKPGIDVLPLDVG